MRLLILFIRLKDLTTSLPNTLLQRGLLRPTFRELLSYSIRQHLALFRGKPATDLGNFPQCGCLGHVHVGCVLIGDFESTL